MVFRKSFFLFAKIFTIISLLSLSVSAMLLYKKEIDAVIVALPMHVIAKVDEFLLNIGFGIRSIAIYGNNLVSNESIEKVVPVNRSLFFLSSRDIAEVITYLHGPIKNVLISKEFPDRILIFVDEYQPFARLCAVNQCYIVDSDGVFIPNADQYEVGDLVTIFGINVEEKDFHLIRDILENSGRLRNEIDVFQQVNSRRWDVIFKSGLVLKLPEESPLLAWASFIDMKDLVRTKSKVIDMRIPDRIFFSKRIL